MKYVMGTIQLENLLYEINQILDSCFDFIRSDQQAFDNHTSGSIKLNDLSYGIAASGMRHRYVNGRWY